MKQRSVVLITLVIATAIFIVMVGGRNFFLDVQKSPITQPSAPEYSTIAYVIITILAIILVLVFVKILTKQNKLSKR